MDTLAPSQLRPLPMQKLALRSKHQYDEDSGFPTNDSHGFGQVLLTLVLGGSGSRFACKVKKLVENGADPLLDGAGS